MTSTSQAPRILIVEDDLVTRKSLARLFMFNGAEVATAATAQEAIAKLAWPPHWVVLDLFLNNENGENVLRVIRERMLPIQVAVVTGSADREQLENLKKLEPDCTLIKPIQFSSLLDLVKLPRTPVTCP